MSFRLVKWVKYLCPIVFLLGLAYTTFYPERKLLGRVPKIRTEDILKPTLSTPFDATHNQAVHEVMLSKCRVSTH